MDKDPATSKDTPTPADASKPDAEPSPWLRRHLNFFEHFRHAIAQVRAHSEQRKETARHPIDRVVLALAWATPLLTAVAFALSFVPVLGAISPYILLAAAAIGLYVALWQAEAVLAPVQSYATTKIFAAAFLGLCVFVAHGYAADSVNKIFGVDAAALPHTTAAATAFCFIAGAAWPFAILAIASLFSLSYFGWKDNQDAIAKSLAILLSSATLALGLGAPLYSDQPQSLKSRLLYHVALHTDFDSKFKCQKATQDSDVVLFISPDQTRAIVATGARGNADAPMTLFPRLTVPADFPLTLCNVDAVHSASSLPSSAAASSAVVPTSAQATMSESKTAPNATSVPINSVIAKPPEPSASS